MDTILFLKRLNILLNNMNSLMLDINKVLNPNNNYYTRYTGTILYSLIEMRTELIGLLSRIKHNRQIIDNTLVDKLIHYENKLSDYAKKISEILLVTS